MSKTTSRRAKRVPNVSRPQLIKRLRLPLTIAFICAIALVIGTLAVTAQRNDLMGGPDAFARKADKLLMQVRRAVEEDRAEQRLGTFRKETSQVRRLSRLAGVERKTDNTVTVDVAATLTADSDEELKAAGFPVQARVGDVATLQVDVDRLLELASLSTVRKLFASAYRYPVNDRGRQSAGIDNNLGQRVVSQTGRGVVVGVIDSGIDFRHLDFTVPGSGGRQTRIKGLLDMTVYGTQSPEPNWNYSLPGQSALIGHLYTEADINAALQSAKPADQSTDIVKQRDKSGHGTHVAGTAAGNGLASPSSGTYAGMAPEADLIIVKASRQNDGNATFRTTDTINAMKFIQQRAAELNGPFVINMSLGGQLGPHDGTNVDERAIDNLVNSGPGRAVCVAAGNDGDASIHASGVVPAAGSSTLDVTATSKPQFVDLYTGPSDRFSVTVTRPDGTSLGPVSYDANGFNSPSGQASDQYLQIFNANDNKGDSDPANDQPDIFLVFKENAPTGTWRITLQDADSNANQLFDAWAVGDDVRFSTFVDNNSHVIGSPGTARAAITVGAFVTRSQSLSLGSFAPFTSPGPTADGRQKPEISAPGYYLYSSRSSDVAASQFGTIGTGGNAPTDSTHYTGLSGTSMATPVTTGSVAVMLQTTPGVTAEQIKDLLKAGATQDAFTGSAAWNPRFGAGKLNIANAINHQNGGPRNYSISGRMTNEDGSAVNGLQILLSGSQSAMVLTDSAGNYRFNSVAGGGNYTVTPSFQPGLTVFTPGSYTFNNLSADQTANFVKGQVPTFNISGRVTDASGNGVANVEITLPGSSTPSGGYPYLPVQTDSNGYYVRNLPKGYDYNVTPSSSVHVFTPTAMSFTNLSSDQTANFVAAPLQVSLRGRVHDGTGKGIAGSSVTLARTDGSQTTRVTPDADGYFTFSAAVAGKEYTVTPSGPDRLFDPSSTKLYIYPNPQMMYFVGRPGNPIDDAGGFVSQHYRDFLHREPDQGGLDYWSGEITKCVDLACIRDRRIGVSGSFFVEQEFQQTGYVVYRFYRAAYGTLPGAPNRTNLSYSNFKTDRPLLKPGTALPQSTIDFANAFVQRNKFLEAYPNTMTETDFVNNLFDKAGLTGPAYASLRQSAMDALTTHTKTRAQVLLDVIEVPDFKAREYNPAWVLMEYFGYLRRDAEQDGYDFWLNVLNTREPGNYRGMVCSFITSAEYQLRFGTVVTRTNAECGQ